MRHLTEISFNGSKYSGWQKQPNAGSVQEEVEKALGVLAGIETPVVGCGRTDAGVHARQFFMHYQWQKTELSGDSLLYKLNQLLPRDIAVHRIFENESLHARFDAIHRKYEYYIHFNKSPFLQGLSYHFHYKNKIDMDCLNKVASLVMKFDDFTTFCKTKSDVQSMICDIKESHWQIQEDRMVFHIKANRFLRGMVRLIVGACISTARGQISLGQVEDALSTRTRLPLNWSVPAHGLYLSEVKYPDVIGTIRD